MAKDAAALTAGQRALTVRIARGEPLSEVLKAVVDLVERHADGLICSILLLDRERGVVRPIAAARLPAEYTNAIDGAPIGPRAGSCGTAAFRAERVIVEDIATSPLWTNYKHLALPHGLVACWSTPIFSMERDVLGTFAMYYTETRGPTPAEIDLVDLGTHLASIAIQRDRTAQALRETERLRARVFSSVTDIIFVLVVEPGEQYRFETVNKAFTRVTGLPESAILGKTVDEVIPEPSRTLVRAKYAEAIATRSAVSWEEVTAYPSGTKHGDVTASPMFDDHGRCTHIVGTVHDMTARREADERHRVLEAKMHQAQRIQALGTLAGGIAHDFNNILTAIGGHVDLAMLDAHDRVAVEESLGEIKRASNRAEQLVRQILRFSRQDEPRPESLSIERLVREAFKLLRVSVPRDVMLSESFPPDMPPIWADATQLHQIFMNLGTNAAHAMRGRTGTIAVHGDAVVIDESATDALPDLAPGPYARIRVTDQGSGMPRETLERVFEPFFTTKPQGEGTGLGLSVVHGIVRSHGGTVIAESEPGVGTTFTLYFPASDIPARVSAPQGRVDDSGHGEHILYVDDDHALVFLAVRMLTRIGYQVTAQTSPALALEALRRNPHGFDIVIVDLNMPSMSGIEFAASVRTLRADLRIVLVSGFIRESDLAAARAAGHESIVLKPHDMEQYAHVIREAISSTPTSAPRERAR